MEGSSLKPGTKVRSTVQTMFGAVRLGDIVTIVRSVILGGSLYIVEGPHGQATLYVDEFEALEDSDS